MRILKKIRLNYALSCPLIQRFKYSEKSIFSQNTVKMISSLLSNKIDLSLAGYWENITSPLQLDLRFLSESRSNEFSELEGEYRFSLLKKQQ
jgi:hypothetical protein